MTQAGSTPIDEATFLREALEALPICIARCTCPDHWHPLWMGLKAMGLLRGIYAQTGFLQGFLAPYLPLGGNVMIAGAADTGLLDVMSGLFGNAPVRYTVVDRCEAPLELVRLRAAERALDVRTVSAWLDEVRAESDPWDMVLVHYTLSFMDRAARVRLMRNLRDDLSPRGVVVCAVRYMQPHAGDDDARTAQWVAAMRDKLVATYVSQPALLQPLQDWLPIYAQSRQHREATMPHFDALRDEFAEAGLDVLACQVNPGQTVSATPDISPPGTITNWMALLRRAG